MWQEAVITQVELDTCDRLILFQEKGIPLGCDEVIREVIRLDSGDYLYRWMNAEEK